MVDKEKPYFSENGEWSSQERDFANRAVQEIGLAAWHDLLRIRKSEGNDAFVRAVARLWPNGLPPELN